MKKSIFILVLCVISLISNAQLMRKKNPKMTNRKHMSMIDFKGYKSSGWMAAPGLTYTNFHSVSSDSIARSYVYPGSGLGLYLEFGRYHIMYNGGRGINYIDYSLAYKGLAGTRYLTANFNANNVLQLSNNTFLQNSLGVNVNSPFADMAQLTGEIHYRFGFGLKMTKKWFLIPTIEIPIINVYSYDEVLNPVTVYETGFQPVIFSLRMAWLRPIGGLSCGPTKRRVKKQKTSNQEQESQKRYNNR